MRPFLLIFLLFAPALLAAENFIEQSVPRLQAYLRVDTINPPGNESRGVTFLGNLLN